MVVKKAKRASVSSKAKGASESISKYADDILEQLDSLVDESKHQTVVHAMDFALAIIGFQRSAFDRTFKTISGIQEKSEKAIDRQLKSADWMPNEGKDVVREWSTMLAGARKDFQKTVDKSYNLIEDYFKRVKSDSESGSAKKPARKKAAAKKSTAKKSTARKTAAKKKAAPKKRASGSSASVDSAKKKVAAAKKRASAKKAPAKRKPAAKKKSAS